MSALLAVEGLTKTFGGIVALDQCSFEIAPGSLAALIGPNGSGKTTAFNVITGYQPADAGRLSFGGRVVRRPDPCRLQRLGMARTFQQARVFPGLSVLENVVLAHHQPWHALLRRRVSVTDRRRAEDLLGEFGLAAHSHVPAGMLSYGQRKLLEFASVLMGEPTLILLDEPTAGVNPVMVDTIEHHIRRCHGEGVSFLIVEHEMSFVMRLCDPVIVLDRGRPIACGAPQEVQNDRSVLDAYLGD
ncbi:MAG: amino acid/amide transporter ATP-binding protein 1, family [Acidimicrobiales bacterium]|nr:amino acid/amide transporter ATP-binding protein 1, family [Acidimicrobiales bacterium]